MTRKEAVAQVIADLEGESTLDDLATSVEALTDEPTDYYAAKVHLVSALRTAETAGTVTLAWPELSPEDLTITKV